MRTFEEFNIKSIFQKEEVLEEIIFSDVLNYDRSLRDILTHSSRIKDKKVSINNKDEEKFVVKNIEITLVNENQYRVSLYDRDGTKHVARGSLPVKIWGKRIKSTLDPYGEENWEK